MSKKRKVKLSRKFNLDKFDYDGDLPIKVGHIVNESQDKTGEDRFYNDGDFMERAIKAMVKQWEDDNYEIIVSTSGLTIEPAPEKAGE